MVSVSAGVKNLGLNTLALGIYYDDSRQQVTR